MDGAEVLIYIGIDTVQLAESVLKLCQRKMPRYKRLIKFDSEKIKEEGFFLNIPVVISNSEQYMIYFQQIKTVLIR